MSKKLITVFGATGNQGGSVISTVLNNAPLSSKYALRGVTRDTSKEASQKLAAQGVEMVKGDLGDSGSVAAAVKGAYAVFAVTNYWETMDMKVELAQGTRIADESFAAGVKHLVWSSLPYTKKLTDGKLPHIDHFDAKAQVEEHIEANKKAAGTAATYVMPAYFMSNIKSGVLKGPDGVPAWTAPWDPQTTRIPLLEIRVDSGKFVLGVLEAGPQATDGKHVHAVSEWTSPQAAVQTINDVAGTNVEARSIDRNVYKGFMPEKIAEEITENMELIGEWKYFGKDADDHQKDHDRFLLAGAKTVSWKEYVEKNGPWKWE